MVSHPALKLLELLQNGCRALHQLGVVARPLREPERYIGQPNIAERLLRDRRPWAVPDQLMGRHAADVMQHEGETYMLEHPAMLAGQDVLQVLHLISAYLADVRVQARFPRPVAQPTGELGEVLRIVRSTVQVTAVETLQPALAADVAKVSGDRPVIELRPCDEDDIRLDVLHGGDPPIGAPMAFLGA